MNKVLPEILEGLVLRRKMKSMQIKNAAIYFSGEMGNGEATLFHHLASSLFILICLLLLFLPYEAYEPCVVP